MDALPPEALRAQIRDFIANHQPSAAADVATLVPGGGTANVPARARKVESAADGYKPPVQVPDLLRESGPATAPNGVPEPVAAAAAKAPAEAAPAKRARTSRRGGTTPA